MPHRFRRVDVEEHLIAIRPGRGERGAVEGSQRLRLLEDVVIDSFLRDALLRLIDEPGQIEPGTPERLLTWLRHALRELAADPDRPPRRAV